MWRPPSPRSTSPGCGRHGRSQPGACLRGHIGRHSRQQGVVGGIEHFLWLHRQSIDEVHRRIVQICQQIPILAPAPGCVRYKESAACVAAWIHRSGQQSNVHWRSYDERYRRARRHKATHPDLVSRYDIQAIGFHGTGCPGREANRVPLKNTSNTKQTASLATTDQRQREHPKTIGPKKSRANVSKTNARNRSSMNAFLNIAINRNPCQYIDVRKSLRL